MPAKRKLRAVPHPKRPVAGGQLTHHGVPHDSTLKGHFSERTAKALRFYGGPAADSVPADARLVLQPQELMSRILGRGHRATDVLLLAERPGLCQAFFIFEEEARPSRDAVFRVLERALRVARWLEQQFDQFELSPVMVVIGDGFLDPTVRFGAGGARYFDSRCEVRRICELSAEEAVAGDDEVALTHAMSMQMAPGRRLPLCAEALVKLRRLLPPEHFGKYGDYLLYCARFNVAERLELGQRVARLEPKMDTLFDDVRNEGQAKGRAEGLAKGLAKGRAEGLLALIKSKGWKLTKAQRDAINTCGDPKQLDRWLRAAGRVGSPDKIFSGHSRH